VGISRSRKPKPSVRLIGGISNIAKLSQGIQVPIEGQSLQLKEGYVRFLRISDYTDVVEPRYIKNPGQQFVVDSDDLVMIRYGYAGNVVRGHVGAIANNLFLIKPEPSLVSRQYLYWYLRQNHIRKFMLSGNTSSTMPQVAHKIVQKVKVYFPSIYEQKQIAARLDSQLLIIEQATNMIEQTIAEIDILSSAILRAAINGEL
jgi:type I restriction enzyme S subunit